MVESMGLLGLEFVPSPDAFNCYAQSFVLELLEESDIPEALSALHKITQDEWDAPKSIMKFWALYWAKESWISNASNQELYWPGFTLDRANLFIRTEALRWLDEHGKDYLQNCDYIQL